MRGLARQLSGSHRLIGAAPEISPPGDMNRRFNRRTRFSAIDATELRSTRLVEGQTSDGLGPTSGPSE